MSKLLGIADDILKEYKQPNSMIDLGNLYFAAMAYKESYEEKQKRIEKLEAALRFYANPMSYSLDNYHGVSGEMMDRCILYSDLEERNDVSRIAGKRAREALAEEGKE